MKKLTQEEVVERLAKKNFILLSKYINRRTVLNIQCYCGNIFKSKADCVFSGYVSSCGCNKGRPKKNIINKKFNRLTAIKCFNITKNSSYVWFCKCDCGRFCKVTQNHLHTGNTKSCGNCQLNRNGRGTSIPALQLNKDIGRGYHNYQTKCGINVDIAFVNNGNKIAIEYDSWYYHKDILDKDKEKTNKLLDDNWKVLRLQLYRRETLNIKDILSSIDSLSKNERNLIILSSKSWGKY